MISFDMGLDELFDDTDEIDKIISQVDIDHITEREQSLSKRKMSVSEVPVPPKLPKQEKQELLQFVRDNRNINTTKKTNREVTKFINYLAENGEMRELTAIPPSDMDVHVGKYIMVLKKDNGSAYEPDTISSYIRYNINIFSDTLIAFQFLLISLESN